MTPEWDGKPERRKDETNVRFALLEKGQKDAEASHTENKESLVAVHKRITEIKKEVADEVRSGLSEILAKIDVQQSNCFSHRKETDKLTIDYNWIYRWKLATWAAIAAIGGWILQHGAKRGGN